MISIVILTLNEEMDLPSCLDSVKWSNDIHVLDSGSTDKTCKIATQAGASISTNSFESFGKQRNFAIDNLAIKNDWIFFLDADEITTPLFLSAMMEAINNATDEVAGFYCCWKMMLEGKWLKHSDNYPKWQFRLLRKGRARFTDFGHGQKEYSVDGHLKYIKEPYIHYGFSKGWSQWIERHNKYSTKEAASRINDCPAFKNILNRHESIRNPALKCWLSKLPGWPVLRFLFTYIFKLGFIEGLPGLIYCINICYYEFLIQIKMREINKRDKGITLNYK